MNFPSRKSDTVRKTQASVGCPKKWSKLAQTTVIAPLPLHKTLRLYLGDSSTAIQESFGASFWEFCDCFFFFFPSKPLSAISLKRIYVKEEKKHWVRPQEKKTPAVKRTLQASTKSSKDILLINVIPSREPTYPPKMAF